MPKTLNMDGSDALQVITPSVLDKLVSEANKIREKNAQAEVIKRKEAAKSKKRRQARIFIESVRLWVMDQIGLDRSISVEEVIALAPYVTKRERLRLARGMFIMLGVPCAWYWLCVHAFGWLGLASISIANPAVLSTWAKIGYCLLAWGGGACLGIGGVAAYIRSFDSSAKGWLTGFFRENINKPVTWLCTGHYGRFINNRYYEDRDLKNGEIEQASQYLSKT